VAVVDEVTVSRTDGGTAVFRVTQVERFAKDEFPTDVVYGSIHHAGLRLITCGGLDQQSGTYDDNMIVFADLVGARTPDRRGAGTRHRLDDCPPRPIR